MSQDHLITLRNKKTGSVYTTRASKKRRQSFVEKTVKLSLKKYDSKTRKVEVFEETKKLNAKK